VPHHTFQTWCTPDCAVAIVRAKGVRDSKKAKRRMLDQIKTRSEWMDDAQKAFNAWVRERDYGLGCISCGKRAGQMQAGHYRSVGACPALRFNPMNCHVQCVPCNKYKSGNQIEYRISLVKRIGVNLVEWLESEHQPNKYTIEEIKEIKTRYSKLARELKKARS